MLTKIQIIKKYYITNQISKVDFTDQFWIDSDYISLEIELIGHRKETKVHLQNELWKFYLLYDATAMIS